MKNQCLLVYKQHTTDPKKGCPTNQGFSKKKKKPYFLCAKTLLTQLLCTGELTDGENFCQISETLVSKCVTLMDHLSKIFCADDEF
jgi:hypothetical protein